MGPSKAMNPMEPSRDGNAVFSRYRPIVADWDAFVESLRRPLPTTLWANPLRLDRQSLVELLAADGVAAEPIAWNPRALRLPADFMPGGHWGLFAGLYQSQEEVSMLPVALLNPQPGERVLDLCAAPGNKTAQIAVAMRNSGTVVANDVQGGRLSAIRQVVRRLGLVNVSITRRPGEDYPYRAGAFDRVLVDAPCTCEGTWRKASVPRESVVAYGSHPGARAEMVRRQLRLLRRAVQLCRAGGRIVYSTCTFAPEENESVVNAVLKEYGDCLSLRPAAISGFPASRGLEGWGGERFHPDMGHCLRVWPHENDTGGFFVAVIEKLDGDQPRPTPVPLEPAETDIVVETIARFGLEAGDLEGLIATAPRGKYQNLVSQDHTLPETLATEATGLPAVGVKVKPSKLTTAAAMVFAAGARCNRVALDADQAVAFVRRREFRVAEDCLKDVTGNGYVLVYRRGYCLGIGRLRRSAVGEPIVESLFPKAWVR